MPSIGVRVHHLSYYHPATSPNRLDGGRIAKLYEPAGIDLRFLPGREIPGDPATGEGYGYWVERLSDERSADGMVLCHLIIGWEAPSEAAGDKGRLLDVKRRGVAAVFTRDPYFDSEIGFGDDAVTQTAAHEIGHLLNLVHPPYHAPSPLVGTMHRHTMRPDFDPSRLQNAWQAAAQEAAPGLPIYPPVGYVPPANLYPLVASCRRWLATRHRPTFFPGHRVSVDRSHRIARHR